MSDSVSSSQQLSMVLKPIEEVLKGFHNIYVQGIISKMFEKLPREIRDHIYTAYFQISEVVDIDEDHVTPRPHHKLRHS